MTIDQPAATGNAPGYRPNRTFPFQTEFRRQLRRRRTQIAIGITLALPLLLIIAFEFGSGGGEDEQDTYGSLVSIATAGGLNFALFTLFATSFLLLILVALVFGDTVASEGNWGSLRYLLAIPVPRSRLLTSKWLVSAISSAGLIALLVGISLLAGTLMYGWQPLQLPTGGELSTGEALLRLLGVTGYIGFMFASVAGLAFLLSVSTGSPIGSVGAAVMFNIVTGIFTLITALGDFRKLFPNYYSDAWLGLLSDPVQTRDMAQGALVTLIYATAFFSLAWWRFTRKDVLS